MLIEHKNILISNCVRGCAHIRAQKDTAAITAGIVKSIICFTKSVIKLTPWLYEARRTQCSFCLFDSGRCIASFLARTARSRAAARATRTCTGAVCPSPYWHEISPAFDFQSFEISNFAPCFSFFVILWIS